jgi:molecular chaperone GrpE
MGKQETKKELNDKYLRLYSEFDNYRKRTAKEKMEFTKVATESLIKELLPVLDDFDRALENIPAEAEDEHTKELYNGVSLIHQKFVNTLKKKELKQVEVSVGSDFDLNFQEAIATIPAPTEEMKGKVIDVVEKGYMLGDAIIRFSKVVVGQ